MIVSQELEMIIIMGGCICRTEQFHCNSRSFHVSAAFALDELLPVDLSLPSDLLPTH